MLRHDRWMVSALIIAGVASSGSMGGRTTLADEPATLEEIPGSPLKRVVLTQKAADRLAIDTEAIHEEPVERWMVVNGEVEAAKAGLTVPAAPILVRVPVPGAQGAASGKAVLILSLGSGQEGANQGLAPSTSGGAFVVSLGADQALIPAHLIEAAQGTEPGTQHYQVDQVGGHGLAPGQDVHVRVAQPGNGAPHKVIPYSAVFYDTHGSTWTYTNPEPLVFVRQPVDIEHIEGDLAVLKQESAVSGAVVTAGAAELWGIESKFGGGH